MHPLSWWGLAHARPHQGISDPFDRLETAVRLRRVATALATGGLSAALVLTQAPPSQAWAIAPAIPPALSVMTGATSSGGMAAMAAGICGTGVGCVVALGAAAVAGIAYWAYSNDVITLPFTDTTIGGGGVYEPVGGHFTPGSNPDIQVLLQGTSPYGASVQNSPPGWNPYGTLTVRLQYQCYLTGGVNVSDVSISATASKPFSITNSMASAMASCDAGNTFVQWFSAHMKPASTGSWQLAGLYEAYIPSSPTSATYQTTVNCRKADGSLGTVSATSAGVAGTSQSITIPSCADAFPGSSRESFTTTRQTTGGSGGSATTQPLLSWGVDTAAVTASYPNCAPGESAFPCSLQVLKEPSGTTCVVGLAGCGEWWETSLTEPERFSCEWGPYSVPLSWCEPLRWAYQTSPELDVNGLPIGPDPAFEPIPEPTPTPTPTPTPVPTAPPGIPTRDDPTVLPDPETPDTPGSCSLGWGDLLNGSVVYKAVSCALAWAFVPDPVVVTEAKSQLETAWAGSDVGTFVTDSRATFAGVSADLTAAGTGGSCAGWTMPVPLYGTESDLKILDSCDEPMTTIASTTKTIGTVIVGVGGLLLLVNTGLGAFGLPRMWGRSDGD